MGWRQHPRTDKQYDAIIRMAGALGFRNVQVPEKKGECCDVIAELKAIIQNHLQTAGMINTNNWNPDDDSMEFMNDIF